MSLEGVNSDSTIPQQQQSEGAKSLKSCHIRKSHKLNWIPNSESETFNTIVINYHYDMEHHKGRVIPKSNKIENRKPGQQQKEQALEKQENSTNSIEEKESLSEFYLCKLYEESLQDLVKKTIEKEKAKIEDETKDVIIKDIIQEKGNPDKTHIILEITTPPDNVSEVFHTPPEELTNATVFKAKTPFDPDEIIVISDDEDYDEANEFSFCPPNTASIKNQSLTTAYMECKMQAKPKTETAAIDPPHPRHASKATATTSHNLKTLECKLREILDPEKLTKDDKLKVKITTIPKIPSNSSNQKLKLKTPTSGNTFKSRQLELHRHRIAVEVKRLELLEVKLARERDEMIREQILFEKELELKNSQIKQIKEDLL